MTKEERERTVKKKDEAKLGPMDFVTDPKLSGKVIELIQIYLKAFRKSKELKDYMEEKKEDK